MILRKSLNKVFASSIFGLGLSLCAMQAQARIDWLYQFDETSATRADIVTTGWMLVTDDAHQNGFSVTSSYSPGNDYSGPFDIHGMGIDAMYFSVGGGANGVTMTLDSISQPADWDTFPAWNIRLAADAFGTPSGEIHFTDRLDASNFDLYLSGNQSSGRVLSDGPFPLGWCNESDPTSVCNFTGDFHLVGQVNVPEPSNLALLGLGLSALLLGARRSKASSRKA